jgi:hypothetical protein
MERLDQSFLHPLLKYRTQDKHIQGGGLVQGVEAVGSYAENQKIAAIRKVYQRAVHTPMLGVEVLWKAGTQP